MLKNELVTVIVPIFNEKGNIEELYKRLKKSLSLFSKNYELIFVDDASSDASFEILTQLSSKDPSVKLIRFSRNFGHQVALTAGLRYSSGDAVFTMDGDLQDPPELLPKLYDMRKKGYDIVYAQRARRHGETIFKRLTAYMFYRLMRRLTNVDLPTDVGDFKLIDKKIVEQLNRIRETNRFLRGLIGWVGFSHAVVIFDRDTRSSGTTKYSLAKMINLALNGILSFTRVPLRLATGLGFCISLMSFFMALWAFFIKYQSDPIPGWTSLIISIFFLGGVQLLALGIMGEYLGRIYEEVKQRPLFIVSEELGFE